MLTMMFYKVSVQRGESLDKSGHVFIYLMFICIGTSVLHKLMLNTTAFIVG